MEPSLSIEATRKVVTAEEGEPMWYYDIMRENFDWVSALRDNNDNYADKFYNIDSVWELFQKLAERSYIEKADCFESHL